MKISEKIESLIGHDVRVYFKCETRRPTFGRFVKESDYEDFKSKGFFRFRIYSQLETKELSKIYNVDAIFDVVKY